MTTIVAVVREGAIAMASDSASVGGDRRYPCGSKVVRKPAGRDGEALIAWAGRAAFVPLVRYDLHLSAGPDVTDDADCDAWAQNVAEAITELALDRKPPMTDKDGYLDGEGLLAYGGRLWHLSENLAHRCHRGWSAIGSGEAYALGALELLGREPPATAAALAVEIACRHHTESTAPAAVEVL